MDEASLIIYKASAGSGKTFTLAVEYIEMLLRDVTSYRKILAVTFTNKATIEMKTRILSQLYGLANGLESSKAYKSVLLERNSDLTDEAIVTGARRAFTAILNDYSNFRVETIDSFFQRVVKQLAHELKLSTSFNIELDSSKALDDAVDSMLENLHNDRVLLNVILQYIEEKMTDDKSWKVEASIKNFSRHIYDEKYAAQEVKPTLEAINELKAIIAEQKNEALEAIDCHVRRFHDLLQRHGVTVADFTRGERGPCGFFVKLGKGIMSDDKFNIATYADAACDPDKWLNKKASANARMAANELPGLMSEAETARKEANLIVNTADLAAKDINNLCLLDSISTLLQRDNEEKNRFMLADTNNLLREMIGDDDPSFIYEKLGNYIEHIMIDEFQDTSAMQWQNFNKLLKEGLANEKKSLIVGDVKQSIYRWRGGDWNILNSEIADDIRPFGCRELTLTTNRRSESNIISFNNNLFRAIVSNIGLPKLQQAYSDVEQDIPESKRNGGGYVKVSLIDDGDNTGDDGGNAAKSSEYYKEETLRQLADEVKDLLNNGLQQKDICILVRRKKHIRDIADCFTECLPGATIISEEAFRLDSSRALSLIVAALRYLNDPKDEISLAKLVLDRLDCSEWNRVMLAGDDDGLQSLLPEQFATRLGQLKSMPLYELVTELMRIFGVLDDEGEQAYVCTFLDIIKDTMKDDATDITAFLSLWDESLAAKTISAGAVDGIRIMTIHKSKGLQAHTILIPFCDWAITAEAGIKDNIVWCDNPIKGFKGRLDILPISYGKRMHESIFKDEYDEETEQMNVDNINLLYVALTRAEKNLIIFTRPKSNTIGEQIAIALGSEQLAAMSKAEPPCFEIGGKVYTSKGESKDEDVNPLTRQPMNLTITTADTPIRVQFRQSNKSARFMQHGTDQSQEYIDQGVVMHLLFSQLRTGRENEIDAALERISHEGLIRDERQKARMKKLTLKRIDETRDYGWFDEDNTLYTECTLIYRNDDGEPEQCRPDRVIVRDNTVTVIDFKFGKPREEHLTQVQRYKDLLSKTSFANTTDEITGIKGYLWYVYDNQIIEV